MPLLDHFRPPIKNRGSWEGFHGGWTMTHRRCAGSGSVVSNDMPVAAFDSGSAVP